MNIKKIVSGTCLNLILFMVALINDVYIRPEYYMYDSILRDIDHILAGIGASIFIYSFLSSNNIKDACITYFFAAFICELMQCFSRGYMQFGQIIADGVGCLLAAILLLNIQERKAILKTKVNKSLL